MIGLHETFTYYKIFILFGAVRGSEHTPESPPVFVKLLSDLLVAEGEVSLFDCVITGEPKPEVKWYLNGDEIVQIDRIKVNFLLVECKSNDNWKSLFIF